jgi:hypothetical protein
MPCVEKSFSPSARADALHWPLTSRYSQGLFTAAGPPDSLAVRAAVPPSLKLRRTAVALAEAGRLASSRVINVVLMTFEQNCPRSSRNLVDRRASYHERSERVQMVASQSCSWQPVLSELTSTERTPTLRSGS